MNDKLSSNFCVFLQNSVLECNHSEKKKILDLLTVELGGILKQIGMLVKTYNASIEFENIQNKFGILMNNINPSMDNLLVKQYNVNYQYLFASVIRNGSYSLQSNRYNSNGDKVKLLENTLKIYCDDMGKNKNLINSALNNNSIQFIENVIGNGVLSVLEDEFLELPSKQNERAFNEIKNLFCRTKPLLIAGLNDICVESTDILNSKVKSHLQEKIKIEKGFTDTNIDKLSLSELLAARKAFSDNSVTRKRNKEAI